jgi:hypothetical protein
MSGSVGAADPGADTDSVSTLTLQLSVAAHKTPTVLAPAFSETSAVTVDQSSQLLVGGSVSGPVSAPFTISSMVRGAGPPSAPR